MCKRFEIDNPVVLNLIEPVIDTREVEFMISSSEKFFPKVFEYYGKDFVESFIKSIYLLEEDVTTNQARFIAPLFLSSLELAQKGKMVTIPMSAMQKPDSWDELENEVRLFKKGIIELPPIITFFNHPLVEAADIVLNEFAMSILFSKKTHSLFYDYTGVNMIYMCTCKFLGDDQDYDIVKNEQRNRLLSHICKQNVVEIDDLESLDVETIYGIDKNSFDVLNTSASFINFYLEKIVFENSVSVFK